MAEVEFLFVIGNGKISVSIQPVQLKLHKCIPVEISTDPKADVKTVTFTLGKVWFASPGNFFGLRMHPKYPFWPKITLVSA